MALSGKLFGLDVTVYMVKVSYGQKPYRRIILFNLSGHGYLDLQAYADYKEGKLMDHEHPESDIRKSLDRLHGMLK